MTNITDTITTAVETYSILTYNDKLPDDIAQEIKTRKIP